MNAKVRKRIIGFVGVIAVVCMALMVAISMQPADFRITRGTTIVAPATVVFGQVNDFHKWGAWSPWEKLDPGMTRTHSGAESGEGAVYFWSGNDKVGEGRMTILESKPDELVRIKLEFIKPFAATNTADFKLESAGSDTKVTWSMYGKNNFVAKAMCMFMDMDKMVGPDFEKGLAAMKDVSEAEAKMQATGGAK
ncbi:MAG TPA: SRPBCC family protein [Candidatus Sumerlaeota bacterium]|nr:SRPBCC family protein [Candidatus Sumerlaeota bacterium]